MEKRIVKKLKKVYVAGKLNDHAVGYIRNMHIMMLCADKIRRAGFSVYVPCLDILMGMVFGNYDYEDYFDNSQPFLEACDYLFVCPDSDNSPGTQKEITTARALGIPIVTSMEELYTTDDLVERKWWRKTPNGSTAVNDPTGQEVQ